MPSLILEPFPTINYCCQVSRRSGTPGNDDAASLRSSAASEPKYLAHGEELTAAKSRSALGIERMSVVEGSPEVVSVDAMYEYEILSA